ncbi:MAG: hypothetical protein ACREDY_05570 [Bradyrhizobium sp.]
MDAEKFLFTLIMSFIMAVVVAGSLALAKRFAIKLPWDTRIAGCPRCGAAEHFEHGVTLAMVGADSPVVRGRPHYGSMTDLINVAAVVAGIGATIAGCVLLLSGAAAWVVASGMTVGERAVVGLLEVGGAMIVLHLGIYAGTWGWRQRFLPPVVRCKSCGWHHPNYAA